MNMTFAMVKSQDIWLYSVRKNTKLHTPKICEEQNAM